MKKLISILLLLAFVLVTACSSPSKESADEANTVSVVTDVQYPLTVVDQAGREVVIESEPQRLISPYYITTSLFIALDIDDRMVGIETNPEKRDIYRLSSPELLDLPTVGSPKDFDFEACVALEPDLVVLPMRLSSVAEQLEELDIDVLIVNPENAELFEEAAVLVATATNSLDREAELISYINDIRNLLETSLADVTPVSIYMGGNSDFLSTAPSGMYQSDMVALAGGSNVGDEIDDTYWAEVSYEQILVWNPEYIVLAANAVYTVEDVLNNESLAICDAVVNGNVVKLPVDAEAWDSPVPGSVLGSLWLASVLYPDVISEETCNDTIEEFYETFYGFSYSAISAE